MPSLYALLFVIHRIFSLLVILSTTVLSDELLLASYNDFTKCCVVCYNLITNIVYKFFSYTFELHCLMCAYYNVLLFVVIYG